MREDLYELVAVSWFDANLNGLFGVIYVEEIEEWIGRMRVMSAERLETELAVHEDDRIASLQEILCGSCTSCA